MASAGNFSSAAIIGGDDDLLTEILVLLPAKSVVRFKSVCKRWRLLISGESFTRLHVQNHRRRRRAEAQHSFILGDVHRSPQFYICHPTVNYLARVPLPKSIKQQSVKILQSLNGLLLLELKFKSLKRFDYAVFNPTTKQYRFIHLDGYKPQKICLLFDPSKSEHYKLVMKTSAQIRTFSVYDSATHQWSHGRTNTPHWTRTRDSHFNGDAELGFRISGPLHQNVVLYSVRRGHIRPIQITEASGYDNYMFDSNGHVNILQLMKPFQGENKRCFRVTDDNWVICDKATLDFGTKTVELLGMIREERIEESSFLFHVPGRLLIYRFPQGKDLDVLVDYRSHYFHVEDQLQFEYAHPFIHTFASV